MSALPNYQGPLDAIEKFTSEAGTDGVKENGSDWLMDNIHLFATTSAMELERLKNKLTKAGFKPSVVRSLSKLVKEYLEEQKAKNKKAKNKKPGRSANDDDAENTDDNDTGEDDDTEDTDGLVYRPIPSDVPNFKVDDLGRICYFDEFEGMYQPLCNFDAKIIANVVEDDGSDDLKRFLAITGSLTTGEIMPEINVKADEYEKMAWVVSQWGAKAIINSGKLSKDKLRHGIQQLSFESGVEDHYVYKHTGWRVINGKRAFLHAGGAIGADNITIKPEGAIKDYVLPDYDPSIDPVAAMRMSLKIIDVSKDTVSIPIYTSMFLAPLSEIIVPDFVLWVEGESGSHKSTYTALNLNHFGTKFEYNHLPADWASTANRLERDAFIAKDVPLVVDDLKPNVNKYENQKMLDAVARLVRSVGNRNGRGRLRSDGSENTTFSPRGMVISTAERGVFGTSTNARMFKVSIEPDDIDMVKLNEILPNRLLLNHAMAGYIRWVGENWDTISDSVNTYFGEVRNDFTKDGGHGRLATTGGLLAAGMWACTEYAKSIGAITEDEAEDYRSRCINALAERAEEQQEVVNREDPVKIYIETIITLLRQEVVQIASKESEMAPLGGLIGHPYSNDAERIGWYKGDSIFLMPSAYNTVKAFVNKSGYDFAMDEQTLRVMMGRRGWIVGDANTKKRVRDPDGTNGNNRVYVIEVPRIKFLKYAHDVMGISVNDLTEATRNNAAMIARMKAKD